MKFFLDQGLPRSTVLHLGKIGIAATHAADLGLSTAPDSTILDVCRQQGFTAVTLDADFHAQLALSNAGAPSVIRVRIEGLRGEELAKLLAEVVRLCEDDLEYGAMISVVESGVRIRRIPLLRH